MKNLLLLFAATVAFTSCQSKTETTSNETAPIKVDSVTYKLESTPIFTKDGDTIITNIKFRYPKFVGGDDAVIAKINAQVEQTVKNAVMGMDDTVKTTKTGSIESLAKGFVKEFEDATKKNGDVPFVFI